MSEPSAWANPQVEKDAEVRASHPSDRTKDDVAPHRSEIVLQPVAQTKFYAAYKTSQNIVCMEVKQQRILLYLKLDPKTVPGPRGSREIAQQQRVRARKGNVKLPGR